jgi:hypothetical protein
LQQRCLTIDSGGAAMIVSVDEAERIVGEAPAPRPRFGLLEGDPLGTVLELRVEAFNLFNRTNFAPPNGTRTAGGFGTITAAYDPRQVQLGVKVLW